MTDISVYIKETEQNTLDKYKIQSFLILWFTILAQFPLLPGLRLEVVHYGGGGPGDADPRLCLKLHPVDKLAVLDKRLSRVKRFLQ